MTSFLSHLITRGRLTEATAERVARVQEETFDRLAAVLLKLGVLSEVDLAAEMAAFSGHPLLTGSDALDLQRAPRLALTDSFLRAHELVPISADGAGVTVACWDVLDEYAAKALAFACEQPIHWMIAP